MPLGSPNSGTISARASIRSPRRGAPAGISIESETGPPPADTSPPGDAGPLKCGRYQILIEGITSPRGDGSGRVKDTVTKLTWMRNELSYAYTGILENTNFAAVDAYCKMLGMRLPTKSEALAIVGPTYCTEAFYFPAGAGMWTSTPNTSTTWWCVRTTGESYECSARPGHLCVQ